MGISWGTRRTRRDQAAAPGQVWLTSTGHEAGLDYYARNGEGGKDAALKVAAELFPDHQWRYVRHERWDAGKTPQPGEIRIATYIGDALIVGPAPAVTGHPSAQVEVLQQDEHWTVRARSHGYPVREVCLGQEDIVVDCGQPLRAETDFWVGERATRPGHHPPFEVTEWSAEVVRTHLGFSPAAPDPNDKYDPRPAGLHVLRAAGVDQDWPAPPLVTLDQVNTPDDLTPNDLAASFLPGTLDLAAIVRSVAAGALPYQPARIWVSGEEVDRTERFDANAVELAADPAIDHLSLEFDDPEHLTLHLMVGTDGADGALSCARMPEFPEQLVADLLAMPGCTTVLWGSSDDAGTQSETIVGNLRMFRRRYWDAPVTIVRDHEQVDISINPGRRSRNGMWWWAAQDLWFTPAVAPLVDLSRVRTLPVGEVIDRPDGSVHVHLFDPTESLPEVRRKQRTLREWLRYDELEGDADDDA